MRRGFLLVFLGASLSCAANDVVRLVWSQDGVRMKPKKVEGVTLTAEGGYATIENSDTTKELQFMLSGTCADGGLSYIGSGKVTFLLSDLTLESKEGCPMNIKCGKRVAIKLKEGSRNELTDAPDTLHKAVVNCKGRISLSGAGALTINARGGHAIRTKEGVLLKQNLGKLDINATGDGCKGIRTKGNFTMHGGEVTIRTTGNYLAEDTTSDFPPMPFGMDDFDGFDDFYGYDDFGGFNDLIGFDDFYENSDYYEEIEDSADMQMPQPFPGGMMMPPGGPGEMFAEGMPDSLFMRQMQEFFGTDSMMMGPPDGGGGGPMRPRYIGTTKGIKAMGNIVVSGGTLEVYTSTPGAEGLEGKQGVELSGGKVRVHAFDDAINANGKIIFSGADVYAESARNDAIDSNGWGDGAITISGGHVEVFSGAGPPEEGFDSDQWAIVIEGGEAFSVGSGMGPWPSMPNERTATQPYLLFQNLRVNTGDELSVWEKDGEQVISVKSPVMNPLNHSLVTSPALKRGSTYVLKINGIEVQEKQL